jgi:hypothetical protein
MVIAVCGTGRIGKSTVCDVLGTQFRQEERDGHIDTDLTQPTLPVRLNGARLTQTHHSVRPSGWVHWMQQLTSISIQIKTLFYAGHLTDKDEYCHMN